MPFARSWRIPSHRRGGRAGRPAQCAHRMVQDLRRAHIPNLLQPRRSRTMLIQILLHTPKWVYALFAALLWLGLRQLLAGSASLTRVTLLPIAMTGLSVYGVASGLGGSG